MPWSPSSTEAFLACPMAWYLKRQGVQGRPMDTTAMDQGTAFHAAMAHVWNGGILDLVWETPIVEAVGRTMLQVGEELQGYGVVGTEINLGGPPEEALKHGRYPGTCDLITKNATGLTVTDYKTKAKMDARFADRELRQTQRSWQLRQYAWFVQKKYQRPVTRIRKLLVAFAPVLKVWLATYPVTQASLRVWFDQALTIWENMDRVDRTIDSDYNLSPWQNPDACERYGWDWRCAFYEICWDGQPIEYKESAQ